MAIGRPGKPMHFMAVPPDGIQQAPGGSFPDAHCIVRGIRWKGALSDIEIPAIIALLFLLFTATALAAWRDVRAAARDLST